MKIDHLDFYVCLWLRAINVGVRGLGGLVGAGFGFRKKGDRRPWPPCCAQVDLLPLNNAMAGSPLKH